MQCRCPAAANRQIRVAPKMKPMNTILTPASHQLKPRHALRFERAHAATPRRAGYNNARPITQGLLLAAVLFAAEGISRAQPVERISDPNLHAWYMYFGDHPIGEGPWGVHFDGQWRRQGVGQKWQQLLLRPGVNYDFTDRLQASGGYAFIKSHRYGSNPAEFVTPEHRIWQQFIVKQSVARSNLAHRFRLEQRYVGVKERGPSGVERLDRYSYRNRFRYFVKGVIPFRRDSSSKYFAALYNEVMFNFGRNVQNNIFDQNRAYVAMGRKIPGLGNLEVGYMQQTVQQGNGRVFEFNHTLQVGLFSTQPFGRNRGR